MLGLATAASANPGAPLIWAFGDSLTAGYGLPPSEGFTAQLEAALRAQGVAATVRNGGISGDTMAQGRARLAWGLRGLGAAPDLVIVALGANDMLRGLPTTATEAQLDAILAELRRRHLRVLLAGMRAAPNLGAAYGQRFEALYPRLARRYGVAFYPFFIRASAGHPALTQADGLHPNRAGVAANIRAMLPAVRAALADQRPIGPKLNRPRR
ncbi:arylesterase [Sphingomonas morindae]|uniref:Arylesterase n=1 Tax=Sphingomonas morindae TaxID=1541170 RepID=A0ABY4XC79_9SPHN|nr:arylesterase [Sphingomonas morindae]USI74574.1 arylesterase [Sphingomonas morindae]